MVGGNGSMKGDVKGENGEGEMVSGTCEEMCFEKRRVEIIVAQMVRLPAW
jgi:hypothetical protein